MTDIRPVQTPDFFATKEELKTFLRGQERFKDFDYEGSNMNVLLDLLSYNTYYNTYYYNMAISEMFLDSASQRNSVISHAKELNYLPTSRRSSQATVNITVTYPNSESNYFTIPEGTALVGRCGNKTYNFLTDKTYSAVRSLTNASIFNALDVNVFEGRIINENISTLDTTLSNASIDTRSLRVTVNGESYIYRSDIYGADKTDKVFYLQPENDDKYSIQFGENRFGVQPTVTDVIVATYRTTAGVSANGVTSLTLGAFGGASSISVSMNEQSSGGRATEDIESIRAFAPKASQIQERAITKRDYETLLRSRFPNIQAISVYGGDEVDPPQFGKVIISVDVVGGEGVADYEIANFKRYLRDKTPLTVEPIFVAAKFMFVDSVVNVTYDPNMTNKSAAQVQAEVAQAIISYQNANLNDFNKVFRQSKLSAFLDNSDVSIISTDIIAKPIIEYVPDLGESRSPAFSFESQLVQPYAFDETTGFNTFKPALSSTAFTVGGQDVIAKDDGNGNIMLTTTGGDVERVFKPSVGTVDYATGAVKFSDLTVNSFQNNAIKFTANTQTKDITPPKDRVLVIRGEDVQVTVTPLGS